MSTYTTPIWPEDFASHNKVFPLEHNAKTTKYFLAGCERDGMVALLVSPNIKRSDSSGIHESMKFLDTSASVLAVLLAVSRN